MIGDHRRITENDFTRFEKMSSQERHDVAKRVQGCARCRRLWMKYLGIDG